MMDWVLRLRRLGRYPPSFAILFDAAVRSTAALLYQAAAARLESSAQSATVERENAALRTRQIWLDSILANGWQAQSVMDGQMQMLTDLERRFADLSADRADAQRIIDEQTEQIGELRAALAGADAFVQEQVQQIGELRAALARADAVVQEQAQELAQQLQQVDAVRRDRVKAQVVMDAQQEQLEHWVGLNDRSRAS
jgi:chromosome segregation ATPase